LLEEAFLFALVFRKERLSNNEQQTFGFCKRRMGKDDQWNLREGLLCQGNFRPAAWMIKMLLLGHFLSEACTKKVIGSYMSLV
jgi:hypothetical protein